MARHKLLRFSLDREKKPYTFAKIYVASDVIDTLYEQIIRIQQKKHRSLGFSQGNAPRGYIEQAYHSHIIKHLKEFLFNYCIADFLIHKLRTYHCVLAEKPAPYKFYIQSGEDGVFTFRLYENPPQRKGSWRRTSISQPGRKKYKDIDRQVNEFLTHETREHTDNNPISIGDWILLKVSVLHEKTPLDIPSHLWLKIGKEATDKSAHNLFLNKQLHTCFSSHHPFLEQYLSEQLDTDYDLGVEIVDRVPAASLSLSLIKHYFQTKTMQETKQRLTEVFSYRHDISQRREIIEKTFKHLFKHFHVSLNDYLIEQQRQRVLEELHFNPDYYVYKAQHDFDEKVYLLAKKQLKETMIIDYIMHEENIHVTAKDIRAYLNLLQRPRTKSFLYFSLPQTQINGQEVPLSYEIVRQACIREKTLNHIIRTIFHQ